MRRATHVPALLAHPERWQLRVPDDRRTQIDMLARAIACMDLTSLGDDDTSETITSLCELARAPVPSMLLDALDIDRKTMVAAVCVYDRLATIALDALHNSPIRVAAVAGGFPAATASQPSRLQQIIAIAIWVPIAPQPNNPIFFKPID